ncbi:hypothetical protein GOV06_03055 [Candidatus Woesearchaeota archaeon]|nr:hypothetical protein [Candidatus Woesearchaeota archaeon]
MAGEDSYGYRKTTKKISYLEDFLSRHNGDNYAKDVREELNRIIKDNPYTSDKLDRLYSDVMKKDKKSSWNHRDYAHVSLDRPLADALKIHQDKRASTLYLDGISIVCFSEKMVYHVGKKIDITEKDMQGSLYFNTDFFKSFDVSKSKKSGSDMRNIAKTFFKVDGKNHVALVQYMPSGKSSSEHYHTLGEVIMQLAGRSFLELRPVDNDTEKEVFELNPGDIKTISPRYLHIVRTYDEGSLTVPIKQTINGKKDHIYPEKSTDRLIGEIEDIISIPHYNSGNETIVALKKYCEPLTNSEMNKVRKIIEKRLEEEKNPNVKDILARLIKDRYSLTP